MADYSQSIDFSAKDALSSGDANKVAKGADIDTELALISTAIATKFDSVDLASQAQAQAGTSNVVLMTPLRAEEHMTTWAAENGAIITDLHALADPGANVLFGWDNTANAAESIINGATAGGGGIDLSVVNEISVDLNDLDTETAIAAGDFIAMVDITDSGSAKITFANLEGALNHDNLAGFVTAEHVDWAGASAGTIHATNFAALQNVVEDTTPVLGADLELGGFNLQAGGVIFLTEQAEADADVAGEGQIWVNTAVPNELWFTNDAGTDFQLSGKEYVFKIADETINNSSTYQDDDVLKIGLDTVSTLYKFELVFQLLNVSSVPDFKIQFTAPTGATGSYSTNVYDPGTDTAPFHRTAETITKADQNWAAVLNNEQIVHIIGFVYTDASNTGDLTLQWAQQTAHASNTVVLKGSWMRIERIGAGM